MKKSRLIICLLIIVSASTAKAQWGYDPFIVQQWQQAAQAVKQWQQQMFNQPFIFNPTPNVDVNTFVVPSTPIQNNQSAEQDRIERKRENLNRVAGEHCKACNGSGKCKACNGTKVAHGFGSTYECTVCAPNGDCSVCHGSGKTSWNR